MEEGFFLGHKDLFLQSREVYESLSHGKSTWKHIIIEFSDHLTFCKILGPKSKSRLQLNGIGKVFLCFIPRQVLSV